MNFAITNRNLFDRTVDGLDDLYVVTQPPKSSFGKIDVRINLDEHAAVIDRYKLKYPLQSDTVSEIRDGKGGKWLLSGGAIIFDQAGRIAVGLRDGNASDPFAYTNIAAGRCDRKFKDHCYEELATEFVVCVKKDNRHWEQINFGKATIPLDCIRKDRSTIVNWKQHVSPTMIVQEVSYPRVRTNLPNLTTIQIYWEEKGLYQYEEQLGGFVLVDEQNHTVEFRLPVEIDLSEYHTTEIFYAEGTGYATWMFPVQIQELCRQTRHDGSRVVTPFLEWLIAKIT